MAGRSDPDAELAAAYRRGYYRSPNAIVGSALKLDPLKPSGSGAAAKKSPWQARAWTYYDEVGEIWFAMNVVANALRKARLIIAKPSDDPTAEPEPVAEDDGSDAAQAWAELDRIQSDVGGQGEILAQAGLNLSVAGECYLVGWTPKEEDHEIWDVLSADQIEQTGGTYRIKSSPTEQGKGYELTDQDYIARIWRRHPRWRDLPDCPMRAILGSLDELLILSRGIRGIATSRAAGNGLLLVPNEISFPSDETDQDEGDGNSATDQFQADLMEHMAVPIQEPDAASAAIPMIVRGAAEYLKPDVFRHLTFERVLDETQVKQREELIRRIANGLDIPSEVLLGLSTGNHWSAWLVDDVMFGSHIEPLLVLICWAITNAYLRPALQAAKVDGADEFVVWYDATAIVKRPNQAQDAVDVYDRGGLSGESLRRYKGFTEDDAPTDEEKAAWDGALPPGQVPQPGPPLAPGRQKIAPAGAPEPGGQGNQENAPKAAPEAKAPGPGTTVEPAIAASAAFAVTPVGANGHRDRLPLGGQLLDLERATRARLAEACDAAVFRTLERAGAKLRRKVGDRAPYAPIIRPIDNQSVAATLGPDHVHGLGFEDHQLVEDDQTELRRKWSAIVAAAQLRVATIARDLGADIDPETYVEEHADSRAAGLAVLLGGLASLIAARLYSPSPAAPTIGEHDTSFTVPMGLVRGALDRAGGALGTLGSGGGITVETATGPAPAGGLTGGPDALGALADAGVTATGTYTWVTGGPTHPFEPHQDLEGTTFDTWSDDQLAADPGEFPYVSFYWPQDHPGCVCDALQDFENTGGPPPLLLTSGEDGTVVPLMPEEEG